VRGESKSASAKFTHEQPKNDSLSPAKSYSLPRIAIKLSHIHEAWVVGSAADPSKDPAFCRDIDILVPLTEWRQAALLIPPDAKPTMFGGWKFTSDGREVDVWPGELSWLMTNAKAKWAWHVKSGIRLHKIST
jgi:hypothetical protein